MPPRLRGAWGHYRAHRRALWRGAARPARLGPVLCSATSELRTCPLCGSRGVAEVRADAALDDTLTDFARR